MKAVENLNTVKDINFYINLVDKTGYTRAIADQGRTIRIDTW